METSLHRQLKELYAEADARLEVPLEGFRIDVVRGAELIEIQHGSLASLRRKLGQLLPAHRVRVVKPIIGTRQLVKQNARGGRVIGRRRSPKRGSFLDVFDELVYWAGLFPHPRLVLELVLVDIEEWRYPAPRRARRRHVVEDQKLLAVNQRRLLASANDLRKLLPVKLPRPFHTGHLAQQLDVPRWFAQRIAYCLRKAGTVEEVAKQGNTRLYRYARRVA